MSIRKLQLRNVHTESAKVTRTETVERSLKEQWTRRKDAVILCVRLPVCIDPKVKDKCYRALLVKWCPWAFREISLSFKKKVEIKDIFLNPL